MFNFQNAMVTGATGCLGGRLAEKLVAEHQVNVHALVRNTNRTDRLSQVPVKIFPGSLTDRKAIEAAASGCEVIFHCAHDFKDQQKNLEAIDILMETACEKKIKCLVYVSSMVVYNFPDNTTLLDETFPEQPFGWDYADTKIACEEKLLEFATKNSLPVVILQPSKTYGPYAPAWTNLAVWHLVTGRLVLPDEGKGICNAVYVDDVADALVLAAKNYSKAANERFLISATPVSWIDFYSTYQKILGTDSIVLMPKEEIERLITSETPPLSLKNSWKDPIPAMKKTFLYSIYKNMMRHPRLKKIISRAKTKIPAPLHLPDKFVLQVYASPIQVSIAKAERLIGYQPKFDFKKGMELTEKYILETKLKESFVQ